MRVIIHAASQREFLALKRRVTHLEQEIILLQGDRNKTNAALDALREFVDRELGNLKATVIRRATSTRSPYDCGVSLVRRAQR